MFKCVLLKVPFLNIKIFRTFREIKICQCYICMFYKKNYIYKLYHVYVEMQAEAHKISFNNYFDEITATH